jgi:hypothetical protein
MHQLLKWFLVWTFLAWPILITILVFFIKFLTSFYRIDEQEFMLMVIPSSAVCEPEETNRMLLALTPL